MDKKTEFKKNTYTYLKIAMFGFFIVVLFSVIWLLVLLDKKNEVREDKKIINIKEGYSLIGTTKLLEKEGLVENPKLLRYYMQLNNLSPKSGPYYFDKPSNIKEIAKRISEADYGNVYKKVMIPEGLSNKQLVSILKKTELDIDLENLIKIIKGKEGYLFPDTYSFFPDANEEDIVREMEKTFLEKIENIEKNKTINKTRNEIIIMASLIEKEASRDAEEKKNISGILWKRISIGMPLQVDAPFLYERGKGSAQLSIEDLKKNSPYNTYVHTGLTPTPIGNPGYDALYASAHPSESEYYFYLHGKNGKIHYAKTYREHLKNKKKYLD